MLDVILFYNLNESYTVGDICKYNGDIWEYIDKRNPFSEIGVPPSYVSGWDKRDKIFE